MESLLDAFLDLDPQDFRLNEPYPAQIAPESEYTTELRRRASLIGSPCQPPQSLKEFTDEIVLGTQNPMLAVPKPPGVKDLEHLVLPQKLSHFLSSVYR